MRSVVKLLNESDLIRPQIINLPTYNEGNIIARTAFFVRFLAKYIYILGNKNIKLVHIHSASKGSLFRKSIVLFVAKLFRKKVIFQIHDGRIKYHYDNCPSFVKKFMSTILNYADMIIALSAQAGSDISKMCSNRNIRILNNPIIIIEENFQKNNNSPDNEVNVIYLGYLTKEKGIFDIIKSAELLENKNIKITLYGNHGIKEVQDLVNSKKLNEKVKINGWISGNGKEKVLQEADILLLPSYFEGMPDLYS